MVSIIVPDHLEERYEELAELIKELYPACELVHAPDPEGKGKGWAVRKGVELARGDHVLFFDGDFDIHPVEIRKLLACSCDVVVGSKAFKGLPLTRRIVSMSARLLIKTLFGLPVWDTQTGIKMFRKDILPNWKIDGFGFDVEILKYVHDHGHHIHEVPIECTITKTRGLRLFRTLWEIISFRLSCLVKK